MIENEIVELLDDCRGVLKGTRGTVVSCYPTSGLIEFTDDEGQTVGLIEVPMGAMRVVSTDAPRIVDTDSHRVH